MGFDALPSHDPAPIAPTAAQRELVRFADATLATPVSLESTPDGRLVATLAQDIRQRTEKAVIDFDDYKRRLAERHPELGEISGIRAYPIDQDMQEIVSWKNAYVVELKDWRVLGFDEQAEKPFATVSDSLFEKKIGDFWDGYTNESEKIFFRKIGGRFFLQVEVPTQAFPKAWTFGPQTEEFWGMMRILAVSTSIRDDFKGAPLK